MSACLTSLQAQSILKGQVYGVVQDSVSFANLEYATIQLQQAVDHSVVTGGITDQSGTFSVDVEQGSYYAVIDFIGYQQYKTEAFEITQDAPSVDLGVILIQQVVNTLKEVVVQAEKSTMELALDKRIFNVGKDLGNAGGSASEILNNIPSVTVDAEGEVSLRGNSNVRILVDGKPSGLVSFKGGIGLQQLQASLIDKVEIITNPSARYEAEGMGGIINIVLKKDRKQGFNGSFEISGGSPLNVGGAANVNYRKNDLNFFINYGISYRNLPSYRSIYQELRERDSVFISKQSFEHEQKGFSQNIRGGLDYFFTETSILTASYLFRRSDGTRFSDIRYEDYLTSIQNPTGYTLRIQDEEEAEPNNEYALSFKKIFEKKGHEFTADVRFLDNWEDSDQKYTETNFASDGTRVGSSLQLSPNFETEKQLLFQVDYSYPFSKDGKLEVGARSSTRDITNDFLVEQQNEKGEFIPLPGFDNDFIYDENIHGAYGILANKVKKFAYQVGIRAEWSTIETLLLETREKNPRNYANLFPSVHMTYDLVNDHAIQVSYSRRIRRPTYRELTPYFTFADNRNFYSGNPDLNPEFSDVFEFGHIKYFEQGSVVSSLYFRTTDAISQGIRSVDSNGFSTIKPENLKNEQAYGLEVTAGYTPLTWWKLDLNVNLFRAEIDASNINAQFNSETTTWFVRQTSRFTLSPKADLQFRANYEAPKQVPQGKSKSLYYFDIAFTQDILGNQGTLTLNASDILNTRKFRSVINGTNFYAEAESQRQQRQINLTLSYRINQ
ncbi:MAG: TonB-dependent receptor [Saprospiraceae bacterium]|nr:TonB-dependent receptor [Saprospiraceae bacterium]